MRKQLLYSFLALLLGTGTLRGQFLGGQLKSSSSSYPTGTVHCKPQNRTAVVEVVSLTGRVWMDRNLGAERVATSSTDALGFGDLYQWGRGADGHQCRDSGTRTTLSSSDQPGHPDFIIVPNTSSTEDWRNPQKNTLWQGIDGINNPCPTGFRIPTDEEFRAERLLWVGGSNSTAAFNSVLKLPLAGFRERTTGVISLTAQDFPYGFIWTSQVGGGGSSNDAVAFAYFQNNAFENPYARGRGYSVRCIKN
jgi:uncharacterized protein (TIGR02145 family)|uniref:hypothetical protein n=1 Tax=Algoriphagus sp. TaxID=1872435 RepID=UPI004047137E